MCCMLFASQNTSCNLPMQHASCPATADQSSSNTSCQHQPLVLLDVQQLQPLPYCLPSSTPSATGCLSALPHASFQEASPSRAPSSKCHPAVSNQAQCTGAAVLSVAWPISHPSPPNLSGDHPSSTGVTPIYGVCDGNKLVALISGYCQLAWSL